MTIFVPCPANNCGDALHVEANGTEVRITFRWCNCVLTPEEYELVREQARRTLLRAAP
jgi:hypothetical protein